MGKKKAGQTPPKSDQAEGTDSSFSDEEQQNPEEDKAWGGDVDAEENDDALYSERKKQAQEIAAEAAAKPASGTKPSMQQESGTDEKLDIDEKEVVPGSPGLFRLFSESSSTDVVTICLYSRESVNPDDFCRILEKERENIRRIQENITLAARNAGKVPPKFVLSVLLIPEDRHAFEAEDEEVKIEIYGSAERYQKNKEKFIEKTRELYPDFEVTDFYNETSDEEKAYLNRYPKGGCVIDLMKMHETLSEKYKSKKLLQIDSTAIISNYQVLYEETFLKQSDALFISLYGDKVTVQNKLIFTVPPPEGHLRELLNEYRERYFEYCNDPGSHPDGNGVYSEWFCTALEQDSLAMLYKTKTHMLSYPALLNIKDDQFTDKIRLTKCVITAVYGSWGSSAQHGSINLEKLQPVEIEFEGEKQTFSFNCDYPAFQHVIKRYTHSLDDNCAVLNACTSDDVEPDRKKLPPFLNYADIEIPHPKTYGDIPVAIEKDSDLFTDIPDEDRFRDQYFALCQFNAKLDEQILFHFIEKVYKESPENCLELIKLIPEGDRLDQLFKHIIEDEEKFEQPEGKSEGESGFFSKIKGFPEGARLTGYRGVLLKAINNDPYVIHACYQKMYDDWNNYIDKELRELKEQELKGEVAIEDHILKINTFLKRPEVVGFNNRAESFSDLPDKFREYENFVEEHNSFLNERVKNLKSKLKAQDTIQSLHNSLNEYKLTDNLNDDVDKIKSIMQAENVIRLLIEDELKQNAKTQKKLRPRLKNKKQKDIKEMEELKKRAEILKENLKMLDTVRSDGISRLTEEYNNLLDDFERRFKNSAGGERQLSLMELERMQRLINGDSFKFILYYVPNHDKYDYVTLEINKLKTGQSNVSQPVSSSPKPK